MNIKGTTSSDTLFGKNGDDFVYALGGDDVIKTGGGDDVVSAYGAIDTAGGNDSLFNIYSGSKNDPKFDPIFQTLSQADSDMGAGDDLYVKMFHDEFSNGNASAVGRVLMGSGNDTVILGQGAGDVQLGSGKDKAYVSSAAFVDVADFISNSSPIMDDVKDTIYIDAEFMKNSQPTFGSDPLIHINQIGAKDKIVFYNTDLSVNDIKIHATQTLGSRLTISFDGGTVLLDYSFQTNGVAEVTSKTFATTSRKITHLIDAPNGDDTHMSKMFIGTDGVDKLDVGSHNVAHMQAGNDVVNGSAKDDALYGEAGNDTLDGKGGDDTLSGGRDNDKITGGNGNDVITLGAGTDKATGDAGNDRIYAGTGNCQIDGGAGDDRIYTYAEYPGSLGKATIHMGSGHDTLFIDGDPMVHATVDDFDTHADAIVIEHNTFDDPPNYTDPVIFEKALIQYKNGVYLDTHYGNGPPDPSAFGIFFEGVSKAELLQADITM